MTTCIIHNKSGEFCPYISPEIMDKFKTGKINQFKLNDDFFIRVANQHEIANSGKEIKRIIQEASNYKMLIVDKKLVEN